MQEKINCSFCGKSENEVDTIISGQKGHICDECVIRADNILDVDNLDDDLDLNFDSNVDVNILGHIFEHSLNEIESTTAELEGVDFDKQKSKRKKDGVFYTPPWMQVMIRDMNDPFTYLENGKTGGLNIIDLANLYSCSFIATKDLGKQQPDSSFEVLGRFDNADLRGCNLMVM